VSPSQLLLKSDALSFSVNVWLHDTHRHPELLDYTSLLHLSVSAGVSIRTDGE